MILLAVWLNLFFLTETIGMVAWSSMTISSYKDEDLARLWVSFLRAEEFLLISWFFLAERLNYLSEFSSSLCFFLLRISNIVSLTLRQSTGRVLDADMFRSNIVKTVIRKQQFLLIKADPKFINIEFTFMVIWFKLIDCMKFINLIELK